MSPTERAFRIMAKHLDYARIVSAAVGAVFVVSSIAEVWRQSAILAVVYLAIGAGSGFCAWVSHTTMKILLSFANAHAASDELLKAINRAYREREGERRHDRRDVN